MTPLAQPSLSVYSVNGSLADAVEPLLCPQACAGDIEMDKSMDLAGQTHECSFCAILQVLTWGNSNPSLSIPQTFLSPTPQSRGNRMRVAEATMVT